MNAKVSIIVPSYNHERYIKKRLDSIVKQTYKDYEVIILEDASPDNSETIIKNYLSDKRFSAFFYDKNSGNPSINWNRGVKKAKGKYVWIAESDDFNDSKFLEVLVEILDNNSNVGIAYCQSFYVDENDEIIGPVVISDDKVHKNRWKKSFYNNGKEECREFLLFKNTIPNASAVLFRRDVYLKAGLANEAFGHGADWLVWFSMLVISDVYFCKEHLNYFRVHKETQRYKTSGIKSIEQDYKIIHEFLKLLTFSKKNVDIYFDNLLGKWVYLTLYGKEKIPFQEQTNIYNIAKKNDLFLKRRFLKLLFNFLKKRLFKHLLSKVKNR